MPTIDIYEKHLIKLEEKIDNELNLNQGSFIIKDGDKNRGNNIKKGCC